MYYIYIFYSSEVYLGSNNRISYNLLHLKFNIPHHLINQHIDYQILLIPLILLLLMVQKLVFLQKVFRGPRKYVFSYLLGGPFTMDTFYIGILDQISF